MIGFQRLAKTVRADKDPVNITEVMAAISGVAAKTINLCKIDFEVLMRKFDMAQNKNTKGQQLRATIKRKLDAVAKALAIFSRTAAIGARRWSYPSTS